MMNKAKCAETMTKNEKLVWSVICDLKGLVLRAQLLIIVELLYQMDERSASVAISGLRAQKLIESKSAIPGCNAVMISLTRGGKALMEGKTQNAVSPITDSQNNNLRVIYRSEQMIREIKTVKNIEPLEYWRSMISAGTIMIGKNDYLKLYDILEKGCKGRFKRPDLASERKNYEREIYKIQDCFNLCNMMAREFYLRRLSFDGNTAKIVLLYYGINQFRTKHFYESLHWSYYMLQRYFRKDSGGALDLAIKISIATFDRFEADFVRKKISEKKLTQYLQKKKAYNPRDIIVLDIHSNDFDRKYKLQKPL